MQGSAWLASLALPTQAAVATPTTTSPGPHAWPAELAQQMQVLRDALQHAARPLSSVQPIRAGEFPRRATDSWPA